MLRPDRSLPGRGFTSSRYVWIPCEMSPNGIDAFGLAFVTSKALWWISTSLPPITIPLEYFPASGSGPWIVKPWISTPSPCTSMFGAANGQLVASTFASPWIVVNDGSLSSAPASSRLSFLIDRSS